MVSLTLKVILHVTENDSKYRDVAPLREVSFLTSECVVVITRYSLHDVPGVSRKWRHLAIGANSAKNKIATK